MRRLDYVVSADGQWVDTLTPVAPALRIEAEWIQIGTAIQQRVFGLNDGSGKVFACYINNNGVWAVNTGTSSGGAIGSAVRAGTTYTGVFNLATGVCTINNTSRNNGGTPFSSTNTIPIFQRRNEGVIQTNYPAQMRLRYFRIYDGTAKIRDFVPALDDNGVACLFDTVSLTPYYSATATQLVAGTIYAGGGVSRLAEQAAPAWRQLEMVEGLTRE